MRDESKYKIAILSAQTGNGHNSVASAIESYLSKKIFEVKVFESFYEDLSVSNEKLSRFYNLLQVVSLDLCSKYTEMAILESKQTKLENYEKYWKMWLQNFFQNNKFDLIISTTPLINAYIIMYLQEKNMSVPFYIVVTDLYIPFYPGFCEVGADLYFVANSDIFDYFVKQGIDKNKVIISGYPLAYKFDLVKKISREDLKKLYEIDMEKKTILINCGAQGQMHFYSIVKTIINEFKNKYNIIVVCGKNKDLKKMILHLCSNIICYGYTDEMEKLLAVADICITKAGANSVFESLYMETYVLVDATKGFLYQERGIRSYFHSSEGMVFYTLEQLKDMLQSIYKGEINIFGSKNDIQNGAIQISNYINNREG